MKDIHTKFLSSDELPEYMFDKKFYGDDKKAAQQIMGKGPGKGNN